MTVKRIYEVSGSVFADVSLPAGLLEVTLVPDLTRIEVALEGFGHRPEREQDVLARSTVDFDDGRLRVAVPGRRFSTAEIRVTLRLPDGSSLRAEAASAGVTVASGCLARLDVRSASGNVEVDDVAGAAIMSSSSGKLSCGHVGGDVVVITVSGDVRVESVGGLLKVTSVSGDVVVQLLGSGAALRSTSGDVTIGHASAGEVAVNTVSGNVAVGLGAGVGAWLDLTTVSGRTSCELPGEASGEGLADLRIVCRTVSGDIRVLQASGANS